MTLARAQGVTLTVMRPDKTGVQITGSTYSYDADGTAMYGAYAELTQLALAIKGTCKAQFKITSGEQILRTEIFGINNGQALDADIESWAGEYDGHNLDEMAENIEALQTSVDTLQTDVSDVKEELQEYEDIFTGNVDESVQNWLDEHPEATTSVQDGSLTESKFADSLKLKAIKDYVTPQMYGAKGDGVADDTNALQSALNNGNVHLKGTYLITNNITIPSTTQMIGCGDGSKIILRNASILLANVDNVQLSDFLIEFSHANTTPALKITDCRFSTFENISIVSDMNFSNNTTTGIDIHCEDDQRFSLNSLNNITIKNCNIGISMYASGSGYITSNVFTSVRISDFVHNAIIFEGGKVYTNLFIGATIQDSFASNYDRYGITQISGYKNDFVDVTIWADARGGAHQFTALQIESISSYANANVITGYIEGMIALSGEYNRLYADFGWKYVDSVHNTSKDMGRIDNTNRSYLCITEWDDTAKSAHEAGTYFILSGTMQKAIANIAVGDALVEGTNYVNALMTYQLAQKDVLYNISPEVSKVTINDLYCCYNGRLVVAMFSLTANNNLASNDDIIKKLPRPCINQTPVTIYDITTGSYLNAILAGDSTGGIVRMKNTVASGHSLRITLTYVATSMR